MIRQEREAAGLPAGLATGPYEVLVAGITPADDRARAAETAQSFAEAGATWWTERINATERGSLKVMRDRILAGPPRF